MANSANGSTVDDVIARAAADQFHIQFVQFLLTFFVIANRRNLI